ncbi:MAG: SGNH/GDSL hydrolase family protein [Armatimonadota bacterium]
MKWIDFPDERFTVNGLPWWEETAPKLIRLPARYESRVRPPVWGLAQSPSGARIRFATESTALGIRAHWPRLNHMNNMPRIGQLGIDVYVDGEYWRPVFPVGDEHDLEAVAFDAMPAQRREICLYASLYAPVQVQAIGLSEGATVQAPAAFAVEKPVAYYGSSITQGGCASRAGMSYQAIVSRALNVDFVNLGFSGNGRGEPELAEAMAEIDASCYVLDWAVNCPTPEECEERYAPFLQIIRDARPDTPVICVTPIFSTNEILSPDTAKQEPMREIIRTAVRERVEAGDEMVRLVEGFRMLGPGDREGLVDMTHPNDIGFVSMARGLEPHLQAVLGV